MKHSWSPLKRGDVIDIIAPASHSPRLEDGVNWIKDAGFIPRVPEDITRTDLFFAAPLEIQLKHLTDALYSDSKVIWSLRGGYGSMRLIPYLKKLKKPKKTKLLMGFSDITALHLFFTQNWNWPVLHSRTVSQMDPDKAQSPDRVFLKELLYGEKNEFVFDELIPLNDNAREVKTIKGTITGGNLRIVQSSLGTSWEIKAKNKILFLEDVSERGYSVDRMLEQLMQSGIIDKGLKAIVFGDFTQSFEKDGKDHVPEALLRFSQRVKYPVFKGLPAGHGINLNYPVPFNTDVVLQTGNLGKLTCTYGHEA